MRGLDISSTKYLEMNYFIDSLITDHEAYVLYYENKLAKLGFDAKDLDNDKLSLESCSDPENALIYFNRRLAFKDRLKNIFLLRDYYINLLSISEFMLYHSGENNNEDESEDIPGMSLKRLKIQELERSKISSDLHDSSIQLLTGLVHKCELIRRLLDFDLPKVKDEVNSVIVDLKHAISDLRSLIFNLRAPSFLDFSLKESLEDYCKYKDKDSKVDVTVSVQGNENSLLPVVKSNIYRICQEAFNNILAHSDGDKAFIDLSFNDKESVISISDNGCGFDFDILNNNDLGKKHFGLLIMKERSEILGGSFDINSTSDNGTTVLVHIPNNPEEVL